MKEEWIALLGRRDYPTDGVEDYSRYLGQALAQRGVSMELVRAAWAEVGWRRVMRWLWRESAAWRGRWVLVQYTALSWSRRGFPVGVLAVLWVLRRRGCRIGVVYHDVLAFSGHRPIDRMRRSIQQWVMRQVYRWADRAVSPVPTELLPWLPASAERMMVIPVGPNIPSVINERRPSGERVVAVFGVTGGANIPREVADITFAVRHAAEQLQSVGKRVRLVVLGRGSREAEDELRASLQGSDVSLSVLGLLPAEEVAQTLGSADVLLFVRGHISGRRGSAIAGIACGLPIVAYQGPETGFPITEAGVTLIPRGDRGKLAAELADILVDEERWQRLRQRSVEAYHRYFSWEAITARLIEGLGNE